MNEISEKKPLWVRAKGAVLHRMRQWAKDLLLFRILPGEYRRAAKQPIQPGKVVFLENKEPTVPESFEVLYERLSRVPELDVEFISLGRPALGCVSITATASRPSATSPLPSASF